MLGFFFSFLLELFEKKLTISTIFFIRSVWTIGVIVALLVFWNTWTIITCELIDITAWKIMQEKIVKIYGSMSGLGRSWTIWRSNFYPFLWVLLNVVQNFIWIVVNLEGLTSIWDETLRNWNTGPKIRFGTGIWDQGSNRRIVMWISKQLLIKEVTIIEMIDWISYMLELNGT